MNLNSLSLPGRERLLQAAVRMFPATSCLLAGAAMTFPQSAQASDWTGATDANWATATNWSAGVPASPEQAVVNLTTPFVATISSVISEAPQVLYVGSESGATGQVDMTGGSISVVDESLIGTQSGTGSLNLSAGAITSTGRMLFGFEGGNGRLEMSGGSIHTSGGGRLIFGYNGASDSVVSGGSIQALKEVWIGEGASSLGKLELTGSGEITTDNWVAIGRTDGNGTLNMSGGSFSKTGSADTHFIIAAGGTGVLNQSGGELSAVGTVWVGENGAATYDLSGTAVLEAPDGVTIAVNQASSSTLSLTGTAEMNTSFLRGGGGYAVATFEGGQVIATADNDDFMSGLDTVELVGAGLQIDTAGHSLEIGQVLEGSGGLVKSGEGRLRLGGYNLYSGATTVEAGTLVMLADDPFTLDTSGNLEVQDGASLQIETELINDFLQPSQMTLGDCHFGVELGDASEVLPTQAVVEVTDTLTVNGEVKIDLSGENLVTGEVVMLTFDSAKRTGSGSFVLGSIPQGLTAQVVESPNKFGTGKGAVVLEIQSIAPHLLWAGSEGSDWMATHNWDLESDFSDASYEEMAWLTFDDYADLMDVELNAVVAPSSVRFTPSKGIDYHLSGSGSIDGSTGLVKEGAGSLTIDAMAHTYTGTTRIAGGTLEVPSLGAGGEASPLGAASAAPENLVLDGGTLAFSSTEAFSTNRGLTIAAAGGGLSHTADLTLTGEFLGQGGVLSKTGSGKLEFATNMNGVGALHIGGGTVVPSGGEGQELHLTGDLWVSHLEGISASLEATGTTVEIGGWFAMGRGNGSGQTGRATFVDATVSSFAMSLGYNNNLADNDSVQELTLEGSTVWNVTTDDMIIGENVGANAIVTLRDTAQLKAADTVHFGRNGSGTLYVEDDAVFTPQRWFTLGRYVDSKGTAYVEGGTLNLTSADQYLIVGENGTGEIFISNGGRVAVNGARTALAPTAEGVGTIHLQTGGTLETRVVDEGTGTGGSSTVEFDGGTLVALGDSSEFMKVDTATISAQGGTIDSGGFIVATTQVFSGAGGITKRGSGMLTLKSTQTYTGTTRVEAGTLITQSAETLVDTASVEISLGAQWNLNFTGEETVASLTLNGVALPAGVYNSTHVSGALTGTGSIRVGEATADAFATWIAGYFSDVEDLLPTADPDGDGQSNLVEFLLGGNPADGGDGAKIVVSTVDTDGDEMDELVLTVAVPTATPAFTAATAPFAIYEGARIEIQGGPDLSSFDSPVTEVSPQVDGLEDAPAGYEYRSFRLDASEGLTDRGFLRVGIGES
ncbi:autotransporter-associated beta strand protein/T5SS/PEP-CTERM-associated repeat protein [Haloferula luteola]|uniref:Autotransporter-associated beta strand protein/T5SS/PEP-CTERM-associated repeat protein n=1 Tax=Haloferula luteola TaxID=595692 RepID=A0A840UYA6_9BACT|nr:autotransporter-associated beta strand repeat-containing protein [Haloferula luteola]MBB5350762.1 autotransporter-associated beta strand protein/T5SS/PEP-CTERM-associated repeat protein [Haloferula luteola]